MTNTLTAGPGPTFRQPVLVTNPDSSCRVIFSKTVLRYQQAGTSCFRCLGSQPSSWPTRQTLFAFSSRFQQEGRPGRMPVPTVVDDFIGVGGSVCGLFLFVQNAASFDSTAVIWARKSKFQFLSGARADAFPPCSCGGWLVDGLQAPVVMLIQHFFKLCHIRFVLLEDF